MGEQYTREMFAEKLDANGDPKLNAAADFAARLLNGPLGGRIERIMLFGSVAVGDARRNSDIDLMVFADGAHDVLVDAVWDAAAQTEDDEDTVPLVYDLEAMRCPSSLFVYDILKYGREIFARGGAPDLSMIDEAIMQRKSLDKIQQKAESHLSEAQFAFAHDKYAMALVMAYTAAELIVRALLLLKNKRMPSGHKKVIEQFGLQFVQTGEAPPLWGRLLNKNFDLRQMALYDEDTAVTPEEAESVTSLTRNLLDLLKRKLEETQHDDAD